MNSHALTKSSEKMMDALFKFKGMAGNGGVALADYVIASLATSVNVKHLGYEHFEPSHSLLKDRINFVSSSADLYFSSKRIDKPSYEPFGNGGQSLVMDCNNGYVLKLRAGKHYNIPKSKMILQPECQGYSEEFDVSYGVFEKVEVPKVSWFSANKMVVKAALDGVLITDINLYNFGYRDKVSKKKRLLLIDADAAEPLENIFDLAGLGVVLAKQVYAGMPFLHKPWRQFKKTMHEDFGIGPRPVIRPKPVKLNL